MKDKIKKMFQWRPGPGLYLIMMALALLLLLMPLIRLAFYSVPWYDDYNYGRFATMAMRKGATIGNALKGAWECIRISWHAWQGTYGSILFMVLMPGIWGESYYKCGPIFLILLLTFAVSVFVYTLLRVGLHTDRVHGWGIALGSAILATQLIHTAQAGFYWYNGGVHYVGMHAFCMLMITAVIRGVYSPKIWKGCIWTLLAMVLAFLVAGGNFVTALQGVLILLTIAGVGILNRRRQTVYMLPVLAVYLYGFYLNVSAPGNDKRADNYIGWGMPPIKSILYSFVEGGRNAWEFTGWMTLVILALLVPLILHMVRRTKFRFPLPGLITLWSVCLYATGFTPSLYSLGHGGLDRTLNAVKLTWQMLLVLNLIYWCGWIAGRFKTMTAGERMCRWWYYPIVALLVLLSFRAESNQAGSFSSYGAYYYVHTGMAYNFYQEYLERVELLKGDEQYVGLTPYHWCPWLICMGDISENPEEESNRALADWYDKEEVFLLPERQ